MKMGVRGPKPESQQNFARIYPERPKLPRGLPKPARDLWKTIVNSLPPDYFRGSETHLLAKFVMADHIYHLAMGEVRKGGLVVTMGDKGYEVVNPALTICNKQVQIMSTLATKLRLCPNSRVSKWQAATVKETSRTTLSGFRKELMFGGKNDEDDD
jgi:P27 family predicted phage terminase small subunit